MHELRQYHYQDCCTLPAAGSVWAAATLLLFPPGPQEQMTTPKRLGHTGLLIQKLCYQSQTNSLPSSPGVAPNAAARAPGVEATPAMARPGVAPMIPAGVAPGVAPGMRPGVAPAAAAAADRGLGVAVTCFWGWMPE
jgi:hypothetical protein